MKTSWLVGIVAAGLAWGVALGARAQGVGLQIGDTADKRTAGQFEIVPGMVYGDDVSFYGLRESYSIFDELRVFLDLGAINATDSDVDFGAQLGALAILPSDDFVCDVGLRTALYYINTDIWDMFGASLMLVTSDETLLDNLFAYGGFGADVASKTWEDETKGDKTKVNPAVNLGLLYRFTEKWSAYAEVSYVDDTFIGAGIRFR